MLAICVARAGDQVDAPLLTVDRVRQLPLVPLLEHDGLGLGAGEDVLHVRDRAAKVAGGVLRDQEQAFVLSDADRGGHGRLQAPILGGRPSTRRPALDPGDNPPGRAGEAGHCTTQWRNEQCATHARAACPAHPSPPIAPLLRLS